MMDLSMTDEFFVSIIRLSQMDNADQSHLVNLVALREQIEELLILTDGNIREIMFFD